MTTAAIASQIANGDSYDTNAYIDYAFDVVSGEVAIAITDGGGQANDTIDVNTLQLTEYYCSNELCDTPNTDTGANIWTVNTLNENQMCTETWDIAGDAADYYSLCVKMNMKIERPLTVITWDDSTATTKENINIAADSQV